MLVAHLSDPHLRAGAAGAETVAALHRALARVLDLDRRPDCVAITGDLVENGWNSQYDVLVDVLGELPIPVHLTSGNHDDPDSLVRRFGGTSYLGGADRLTYAVDYPDAVLVALHSPEPDGPGGRLGPEQLSWLDVTLARRPGVPAFVCLHHPPSPVGIPFLDAMGLRDAAALREVLLGHPHVVRILAGHVHRAVTATFAGTTVSVAPSTYRQSTLTMRADGPMGYVHEPAGFLLHLLDGRLDGPADGPAGGPHGGPAGGPAGGPHDGPHDGADCVTHLVPTTPGLPGHER